MESLVIHAVSRESAEGFCAGLEEFGPTLVETGDGRYQVEIPIGGGDQQIVAVLNALEVHVTRRGDGPARVDLNGYAYTMHAADNAT